MMLASIIALGGVWIIDHLDNSLVRMPSWLRASDQTTAPDNRPSGALAPPPGHAPREK
jgi:hypothetical protein